MSSTVRGLPQARRPQEGFLLVEVLIASGLLLVVLLAVIPLFTLATRQNASAKDLTVSTSLAVDKIEEFTRWPCDQIRRGTCCQRGNGTCADETLWVEGIRYKRSCVVRQTVANNKYANDVDSYTFPPPAKPGGTANPIGNTAGFAYMEVTVQAQRMRSDGTMGPLGTLRPAYVSLSRVADCVQ